MICGCNSNEVEDTVPTQPDPKITTPTPARRKSIPLEVVVEEDGYSVSSGSSSASSEDERPPSDDDDYENAPIIDPSATNVNTEGYLEGPPTGWGGNYSPEVEVNEETAPALISGPRKANMKNVQHHEDYIDGTRTDQEVSAGVMDRIQGLEEAGLQTTNRMGRKMLTPRIITDVKEMWDRDGNITREMTHYIEAPDGTKRTEKETVYIAAAAISGDGEYARTEEASDGGSEGESGGWEADLAAEEERNKQYKKSSKYSATTSGEGGSDDEIEIFVDDEDEDKDESDGWEAELAAEEEKNKQYKKSSPYTATTSGDGASEVEIEIKADDEDEEKDESGGWEAELAAEEEKNKQFKKSSK